MSSAAAIAAEISPKNNSLVEESREPEMSVQAAATVTASTAGAGVTNAAGALAAGDLSSTSLPSPHQASASISYHTIEQHCRLLEEENQQLKESEARLQQQHADSQRRERLLMRRLANKEQELQDYAAQIAEYKNAQAPGQAALRSALLDPAVNILFDKLKHELQSTRAKLEETQNELSAWKFTPDSNTGKRLMAKCRLLYQENEELGKMTSNGRLAKLEGELAMQKSFSEEVKKSQSELDDFIQELDEDVEGMQSTILFLQQELKAAKDRIQQLEKENCPLKSVDEDDDENVDNSRHLVNGKSSPQTGSGREISDYYASEERTPKYNKNSTTYHIVHNSNNSIILRTSNLISDDSSRRSNLYNGNHNDLSSANMNGGDSDMNKAQNEQTSTTGGSGNKGYLESSSCSNNSTLNNKANKVVSNQRKRNYDSDSSENSSTNGCTLRNNKKLKKKARRSSVLSIDLNEEDTQIADESDEDELTPLPTAASAPPAATSNQRIMTRRKSARNHQNGDH